MSQSNEASNPYRLQIILALIAVLGGVLAAVIPLIFRDPPDAIIELTVQAIQANNTRTAEARTTTSIHASGTLTPVQITTMSRSITTTAATVDAVQMTPTKPAATSASVQSCVATVRSNSNSTILNVVKERPSFSSRTIGNINRDESLTLVEKSTGSDVYYLVYRDEVQLGWVAAEYLIIPTDCL